MQGEWRKMSQRGVEGLLGRLVTDRRLRRRFFEAPEHTCLSEMYEVSEREMEALLALGELELEFLAQRLDDRIVRAPANSPAALWEDDCAFSVLSAALARNNRDN